MKLLCRSLWLFLALNSTLAQPTSDGLYARFETSQGTFYCLLHYDLVPRTVANFVGLTEGTRSFIDYSRGRIAQRPFFDGLTFHRVVTNFVIQGGSANGLGNDNPGFRFKDEFHASLNHNEAGVLSMANSGTNSNGSQFFITLNAASHLNNRHSVFGRVVEGLNVVQEIGSVAVDMNSRPIVPVYMTSVTILRIGSNVMAFNAAAVTPPLPEPRGLRSEIYWQGGVLYANWPQTNGTYYPVAISSELDQWQFAGNFAGGPVTVNRGSPWLFIRIFETEIDP